MKKFSSVLIFSLLIFLCNNASAFYIWEGFDNPGTYPPAGWTTAPYHIFNWDWASRCSGYGLGYGSMKANLSDAPTGTTFDIITPQFSPSVTADSLIFDHAYANYAGSPDQLKVSYSTDGGATWTQLVLLNYTDLVTAPATATPFVPTPAQWGTKRYALPAGTNKIKFTAISGYGQNLFIDNVKIGTRYTTDVGAVGFSRYLKSFTPGTIDTPKVYVKNFGTTTATFPLTVTIAPGTYNQTQTVTSLAPGAITQVAFSPWTPVAGNYTYKAYSALSGDLNNFNDTIYGSYFVTNNPKNVLVEYCTGTWCQWCPCGKTQLHELEGVFPNVVILAYHGSGSDPWITFNGNSIIGQLGMSAYPTGTPDRQSTTMEFSSNGFFEYPMNRYMSSPVSQVKIDITNKNFNPSTGQLDVTLNATSLANLTGQFKINYVITEDNLVYPQTGNSYCVGGSTYVHYWVVRNMVNSSLGENLNTGGTWNNGQVIPKTFTTTVNSAWVAGNCKLKIFIYQDGSPLYMATVYQAMQTPILVTSVNDPAKTAVKFELAQNYPNPFNPTTNIKFAIPKDGQASLKIYDITGKLVETYLDTYVKAGYYNADFDGTKLASGTYFYTLITNGMTETKKMILIK